MGKKGIILLAAGAVLVLTACGGGGTTSGGDEGVAVPTGAAGGSTISVALGESGAGEMYMNLSQPSVTAGEVTFVVTNEGNKEHEFVVLKTDTPASGFKVGSNDEIDEEAGGSEVVDEDESIKAGATDELTVKLEPGHYALLCNYEGHYGEGMHADLEVT